MFSLFAGTMVNLFDRLSSRTGHTLKYQGPSVEGAEDDYAAVEFSIAPDGGDGKGAAKVLLTTNDIEECAEAFANFDPNTERSVPEIIRTSLQIVESDEGSWVSFKTSDAKHSRSCRVPVSEWDGFVRFVQGAAKGLPAALAACRAGDAQLPPVIPPEKPVKSDTPVAETSEDDQPKKRGRGRPRKVVEVAETPEPESEEPPAETSEE